MRLDSISRLRYFNDIALTGSFSRSARRLGIAQPALSIAIKKLEEETGLKLINRADRRMSLTSDGEVLLAHTRRILGNLTDATRELAELRGRMSAEEEERWEEVKREFKRRRMMGGGDEDPVSRVAGPLATLVQRIEDIRDVLQGMGEE
jgi:molybdenum-dependent DNA-binding transcriptional regulator ModE